MSAKTVAEVIAQLQKLPPDMPMYFDCPHCGRANIFSSAKHVVVIETEKAGKHDLAKQSIGKEAGQ